MGQGLAKFPDLDGLSISHRAACRDQLDPRGEGTFTVEDFTEAEVLGKLNHEILGMLLQPGCPSGRTRARFTPR